MESSPRTCRQKIAYDTRQEARLALKGMDQHPTARTKGIGSMEAYHCPHGDHWHLGHAISKKQRRAKRPRIR